MVTREQMIRDAAQAVTREQMIRDAAQALHDADCPYDHDLSGLPNHALKYRAQALVALGAISPLVREVERILSA